MKLNFASALALLGLVVALCSAGSHPVYDPNYCDPFPKNQIIAEYSSCGSDLSYGSNEQGIIINAFFFAPGFCPGVDRVINRTIDRPVGPSWKFAHTLTYSIMWTDPNTNCVFGPSDIGTDQNGIMNEPLANISQYALNKWYTREFAIAKNRTVNFSIACASSSTTNKHVSAMVKDIKWSISSWEEYSYQPSPCPNCRFGAVPYARCLPTGIEDQYGRSQLGWVLAGDYFAETLETAVTLNVTGNVVANELYLGASLYVTGCFYSYDRETGHSTENIIKIYALVNKVINVVMDPSCPAAEFQIIPMPYYTFPGMPSNRTDCKEYIYDPSKVTVFGQSPAFQIFVRESIITCLASRNSHDAVVQVIIISVLVPTVCLIGIAVGVFFAIKKHRQSKLKKEKAAAKASLERNAVTLPTAYVTTKGDGNEAAVQH